MNLPPKCWTFVPRLCCTWLLFCSPWEVNFTTPSTCKSLGSWRTSGLQMVNSFWIILNVPASMSWRTCIGIHCTLLPLLPSLLCTKEERLEEDQSFNFEIISLDPSHSTLFGAPYYIYSDESSTKVSFSFRSYNYACLLLSVCLARYLYQYKTMDAA